MMQSTKRGSTILLVLAMLSILLLLAIAFSYGTRMETQASYNYAQISQARVSAATGLPMAAPMLADASQGLTSTLQPWSVVPEALNALVKQNGRAPSMSTSQLAMLNQAGVSIRRNGNGEVLSGPQAVVQVRDLSSMTNLNAVEDPAALARVVQAIVPGGDNRRKTQAIMALRGEALSGNPARTVTSTSDDTKVLDPRDPNAVLLDSLSRLRYGGDRGQPLFTDEEIQKLEKFVTVFSQAPEVYNAPDGTHVPRISLHAIDPEVVYERLRTAFPHKKQELLLQFAANVADFSDEDDEPTILDRNGKVIEHAYTNGMTPSNVTIGVEMVPMISEVYPDSKTSVEYGDDGQFVEIANPWSESISLSGWSLRTANGNVPLNATLPGGGVLVITDNLNRPDPNAPTGEGSIVSIFGATPDGASRQVEVAANLDLPDRSSQVTLYDNHGKMVDVFSYDSSNSVDGKSSFQRPDPVVRGWRIAEATPFSIASFSPNSAESRTAWAEGNTTMTKLSQLFKLSTGFAEYGLEGQSTVHASQVAQLTIPEQIEKGSDPYPTNLDLRLVDIFTVSPPKVTTATATTAPDPQNRSRRDAAEEMRRFRENLAMLRSGQPVADTDDATSGTTTSLVYSYGKLNLNTCSKFALLGLDLGSGVSAQSGLQGAIEKFEAHRITQLRQGQAPFRNVSDFISRFTPQLSRSNLSDIDKITDQVSVGSSAFEVTATNRLSQDEQKALESGSSLDGPRPATATAKWVVSMDQPPYEIISFTLVP